MLPSCIISLLRTLTEVHPEFLVWKHLDQALAGHGDIDGMAPDSVTASAMVDTTYSHLRQFSDFRGLVLCNHLENLRSMFLIIESSWPLLMQIDLYLQPYRGGSTWADPAELLRLSHLDENAIRRTSAATEAVVSLVLHGISQRGSFVLSSRQRAIVMDGLGDTEALDDAIRGLVPPLAQPFIAELSHGLQSNVWLASAARKAWWAFLLSGLTQPTNMARRVMVRVNRRLQGHCLMGQIVHDYDRIAPVPDVGGFASMARESGHLTLPRGGFGD